MPEALPAMDKDKVQGSGSRIVDARETFSTLLEMSRLLNTGLDAETLAICVRLCEQGANPEALATIIRELRRESSAIRQQESSD
jgi:mitotic-spindle organizing protein 1